MSGYPFAISLSPNIQINTTEDSYILSSASEGKEQPFVSMLTLPTSTGMAEALAHLRKGNSTTDSLIQILSIQAGTDVGEQFAIALQQLDQRGWLNYAVLPLAVAIPIVETAKLDLTAPDWTQVKVSLSQFAYQRTYESTMVLESPLSQFRVKLLDWRASALLSQLSHPQTLAQITPPPYTGPETGYQFLNLLWAASFLTIDTEAASLQLWDFHNLLFHSRSRLGRHDYPTGGIERCINQWSDFPVVKPPMSNKLVPLLRPSLETIAQRDTTLTTAIEARKSIREYDDVHPITLEQLSELLYRTARVKEIYTLEEVDADALKAQFGSDFEWGELSRRPYPCGGSMYELEIYPVVRHCEGLISGLYHYDPLNHQLAQLDAPDHEVAALIADAHLFSGEQGVPQVLLVITARFGRLFRKYRSLAYALVLKHVGVLYQNLYLVATNMALAPCSLGASNSDCFARATGLDYIEESSVGEFMLGSLPNQAVTTSEVEHPQAEIVESQTEAESVDAEGAESGVAASEVEADLDPVGLTQEEQPTREEGRSGAVMTSEVEVAAPESRRALHPHDLDDRIPGLADLRNRTLGDPRITIVILDGNPDHTLSCFQGTEISKVFPYWHEPPSPISPNDYATYREVDNSDLKGEEKEKALKAALAEPILNRIVGDNHACHITSTIVGQEHTPSPGLAPKCRVINIPLNTTPDLEEVISPLNLARAFELALDLGANLIHCAFCRPTQTGEGEEMLNRAVKKCQDNNILIVAPAGNNKGECWCLPAALPRTLAVGAMKADGTPYKYSNWGANYTVEGIMAPGGDILGAQPATEEPVRLQGTSMAAPVVTGLFALLMSLQLQEGRTIDAEAIRAALLNTAIPCDPKVVEEPERCLRGLVNLPGAMGLLFGQSVTISFVGEQVLRTERTGYAIPAIAQPTMTAQAARSAQRQLNHLYTLLLPPVSESTSSSLYKAFPTQTPDQSVAIKLFDHPILRKDLYLKQVDAEEQALRDLAHPHIVQLLDRGIEDTTGYPFLVLEWLHSSLQESFGTSVREKKQLYKTWEQFYLEVGQPALEALAHCHQHSYVQRDFHPCNLMWTHNGQLKLIDFGLSRHVKRDPPGYVGMSHLIRGKLATYQAPEPEDNEFAYTRDVFAFGILALDCLSETLLENRDSINSALQKLNVPASLQTLLTQCFSLNPSERPFDAGSLLTQIQAIHPQATPLTLQPPAASVAKPSNVITPSSAASSISPAITPSTAHSGQVYALGTVSYDFGDEARLDTFRQLMPPVELDGIMIPPDPYDVRQMVEYLDRNLDECRSLIWLLNLEQNAIYALEPNGVFADHVYEMLLSMLAGQLEPQSSDGFIERINIPARRTNRTVTLLSEEVVPVVTVPNVRGMYGWRTNTLINEALAVVPLDLGEEALEVLWSEITSFLNRVYHDLHNIGQTSRDRALNFSTVNVYQATSAFAAAISEGYRLDTIGVEKSPYCRLNSDCWDIKLIFSNPENSQRARKVFTFTIDVADLVPVTIGQLKSWYIPNR